ncbi:N-acetylgalactosamine 6-sulfate sulfatase [Rhodopirellula sp. SM50]|nr:sulfatase-like hydrolase/transferase [Rhodopirellula sp. SM50]PAY18024.1 N-acetylgalactosamine 6-sulfate sulfatase [Rhodopirellula sp. SM50]
MKLATYTPLLFLTAIVAAPFSAGAKAGEKPNVILIMCDDLGWGDVGFNGGKNIRTPHLDEMAANGLNLTRFYAQAPVCSPTRASVVTGRHHDRTGIYTANNGHLREGEFTLYEALAAEGYATGHFGKWHMGTLTRERKDSNRGGKDKSNYSPPWQHAVDTTFATEAKTPTYDPMWQPAGSKGTKKNNVSKGDFRGASGKGWHAIAEGAGREFYGTRYWTGEETFIDPESEDLLGDDSGLIMDRALAFIDAHRETPFLAVVWFHAPHLPVVASKADTDSYADADGKLDGYHLNYYGCVTALDRAVGKLRARLREHGIADNTLVAFTSDNGPEGSDKAPGRQGRFKGRKRSLYEGGVRVPGLFEWPAKIKPGTRSDVATCTVDYFPTILDIVGVDMPDDRPLDGVSLVPLLEGGMETRPRPLGFHIRGQAAWHDGDWKAYCAKVNSRDWELYNLKDDPGEKNNHAAAQSAKLKAMVAAWEQWKASVDASDKGGDY